MSVCAHTHHPAPTRRAPARPAPLRRAPARLATSLLRAGAVCLLALAAIGGVVLTPGALEQAHAASLPVRALHVAASKKGAPYSYGAAGPYRFDCSGLTLYSFRQAGKLLPRTAAAQYGRTRHIPAAARLPGDLAFFHVGPMVYHVGIYAGHGRIWHAPRPGSVVRLERIWTSQVWYGRVR